jgi:DNA repair protein RecN (Recombination protein N)
MISELSVHNLALIEDVRVELAAGFNAWTGETGAGKSLLLGAMGLLIGERGSTDLIRSGADELRVTGVFQIHNQQLKQSVEEVLERPLTDSQIIISRRLHREGGSKAYVDDEPVSVNTLKKLGEYLVDVHGQRESHSLLEPTYQVRLLDSFGKLEKLRATYDELAHKVRELRKRRSELVAKQEGRARELDLIRFEKEEIDQAQIRVGEVAELQAERNVLMHAQGLSEFTLNVVNRLYDDEISVVDHLGKLAKEAAHWAGIAPSLSDLSVRLSAAVTEIRDLAETARDLCESYEADPIRLEEVEKRLQLYRRLETKYRKSPDELLSYRESLDRREKELLKDEADSTAIDQELKKAFSQLQEAAENLSKARAKVGKKLAMETQKHLANLGMPNARLDCGLKTIPLGETPFDGPIPIGGADDLELLLAANPGEPMRPLRKIASGGEMSRTMLALKTVLAAHDPVGTLVFDEIDANVGGRLGDIVGEKLAHLGKTHQVICVTHLPQVACYAQHQWAIRKNVKGKRTTTTISPLLTEESRIEELASMMRGEAKTDSTRQEAQEMLKAAKKKW